MSIRFFDEKGGEHRIELKPVTLNDPKWIADPEHPGIITYGGPRYVQFEPQAVIRVRSEWGKVYSYAITSCGDDEYHYKLDGLCWHTRQFSEYMAKNHATYLGVLGEDA